MAVATGMPRWFSPLALIVAVGIAIALGVLAAIASAEPPRPSLDFLPSASGKPCADPAYPECRRLRFVYGPLPVTPGNNAPLVGPVTIEKPAYDGYAVRTFSDLVRSDGSVPPVDAVHLHHGVWTSVPQYGNAFPFYGTGEEKTVFQLPTGYGMLVRTTDNWQIQYMLHNQTTRPENLFIVYDVDYLPLAAARKHPIKTALPIWLSILWDSPHQYYPVFNVQKGYGKVNPKTGRRECTYPRDRCAAFSPFGGDQPGNGTGYDWVVPKRYEGTFVGMGGHLHPGGLRDEVSILRRVDGRERARRIFNSRAVYYDPGGPVSWDLSMTVTPPGWRVAVKPGDTIRLNAVYDSERGSWYEDMGIVMGWLVPGDRSGADPFQRVRARGRGGRVRSRYVKIPTEGQVTHGHLPESSNYGGGNARPLPGRAGPLTTEVKVDGFAYHPGDLSRAATEGIPRVKLDSTLTFRNYDASASIWHTITACKPPCTGTAGISYPLADDDSNLDSLELGFGPPHFPTGNRASYSVNPRQAGLKPGETYTYFCRVHPFMRGAFRVVQ